ncbi:hypothetical protein SRABI106_02873 [Rahnella aquatilis]|nr:hypothetical protein SRABI106_02873 [Rahnella aquatilis]
MELVDGETRNLNFSQGRFDGNRRKASRTLALFFEVIDIFLREVNYRFEAFKRGLQIVHFFRHQFKLIDRAVQRQRRTVAVIDNAAAGRDRHQLDTVIVRTGLVILKTDNLQIIKIKS